MSTMARLEADRLGTLLDTMTQESLDNQREVVLGRGVADHVLVNDRTIDDLADALLAVAS